MSPHILAVLKLRKAELLFHFDNCVSFALRLRRMINPELTPLTTTRVSLPSPYLYFTWCRLTLSFSSPLSPFLLLTSTHISSGVASWLFELKSFNLIKLPKSENPQKPTNNKTNNQVDNNNIGQSNEERDGEKAKLPETIAFQKHLQFLNRFVYSKKKHQKMHNMVDRK